MDHDGTRPLRLYIPERISGVGRRLSGDITILFNIRMRSCCHGEFDRAGGLGARGQVVVGRRRHMSCPQVRTELCDYVQCQHAGRAEC